MIDLHCHLAYGIDDGPQTPDESLALALALSKAGVTHVACTSHIRRDKDWVNDQSAQSQMHDNLDKALGSAGPKRFRGAEHYIDELLVETCQNKQAVPYGDSDWLLVELPYSAEPPNLMRTLYAIREAGYKLLLAHIERYPYIYRYPEKLEALVNAGHRIQVNLGSLAGAYGPKYQNAAQYLLQDDYVYVLAGDCHHENHVQTYIIDGLQAARTLIDEETLKQLTLRNPARILGLQL